MSVPSDRVPERPKAEGGWRVSLLVAGVALAAHLPALWNGFVLDDHSLIEQSEAIRHPLDLAPIWLSNFWGKGNSAPPYYRPLVTQSFALNYLVAGASPLTFHAANLLLHAVVALLLHRVARRLLPGTWPAALAALIFASHPLASEPVDAIYGRTDLLAALFTLSAVLAHLRVPHGRGRWLRFLPPAALYLLALLSKESAAPLPLALLVLDAARSRGGWRESAAAWTRNLPGYLLPALSLALYVEMRATALGGMVAGTSIEFLHNPLTDAGFATRLLTAPILLVKYLQLWLLPVNLSPDYSFNELPVAVTAADPRFVYCLLVSAGFLAGGIWLARRRHPAFLGWGFFAAFYLLVSNLLFPVGALLAERFLYLPMAGLCLMAGGAVGPLLGTAPSTGGLRWGRRAAFAILVILAAGSFRRASTWRDDATVARASIAAAPAAAMGYLNLAVAIAGGEGPEGERHRAALELYLRAIEIYPEYVNALFNAGVTLTMEGRRQEAVPFIERAYKLQPAQKGISYTLGVTYFQLGRSAEAAALLAAAVHDWPEERVFRSDYGAVLESVGRDAEAREQLLVALDPEAPQPAVVFNLALVEVKLGRYSDAMPRARFLVERDPRDAGARTLLGRALEGLGDTSSALDALKEAVRVDPGYAEGWYRLSLLQRRLRDPGSEESLRRAGALGHPLREGSLPVLTPEG